MKWRLVMSGRVIEQNDLVWTVWDSKPGGILYMGDAQGVMDRYGDEIAMGVIPLNV